MAGQQQQIIETIFNMKRRLLRNDDSSDSEEPDSPYNNRMQNLKRKAQYARPGRPETSSDPPPYKKRIEHAGYHRYILQRNPPRFDPDGDIVEHNDEYDDEDDLSTVEENPYADIKLEEILMPLTSAADLATHPAMSIPYTSKHLTNLTNEAAAISRKERVAVWRAKNLFTQFLGDISYVPTGLTDLDAGEPLKDSISENALGSRPELTNGETQDKSQAIQQAAAEKQGQTNGEDVHMKDAGEINGDASHPSESRNPEDAGGPSVQNENQNGEPSTNGDRRGASGVTRQNGVDRAATPNDEDVSDTASQQNGITTRAAVQGPSDQSTPSSPSGSTHIHPLFSFSTESIPDRDLGLPANEAEDTRFLLLAFVQKQEELSRTATDLYMGMLQGERMRQEVYKSAKAEAHVGEMSDGEDWYDQDEWELEQSLLKGRDEEEDDTAVAGKKSTRQRRKPDKEDR
ncbi:hypothetical protein BU24DRAFT_458572 [Aaosphaeria arxii CBS 175.79]|uniref:Transcriptional regulatory protein RXT2 N-terminal domain-containing protein n=1 Tax=Aaosphaeria arxii CBS 175.79 TaxID=1450172 RepID=A0A6A5XZW7_9PLEO|nr:uncharacterized protein BU24DRAFT_458572 [Aaosphaeria arxii CBS 175.79]KAF2018838.1 hypothetical protein BU24DRAFT_458572 [Aaosphaeria arxii CBS 175.79]